MRALDVAILTTLPEHAAELRRRAFDLARELKAIPEYADAEMEALRPLVKNWQHAAGSVLDQLDFDDVWELFIEAWPKVTHAAGEGPLDQALRRAIANGVPRVRDYGDRLCLLIALCRELQRDFGSKPFYLGGAAAAKVLGLDQGTVSRKLRVLVTDGVLKLVKRGCRSKNPRESGQASEYFYVGQDL